MKTDVYISQKKRLKNILTKPSKKHVKEFILSKAAGFLCKTKTYHYTDIFERLCPNLWKNFFTEHIQYFIEGRKGF